MAKLQNKLTKRQWTKIAGITLAALVIGTVGVIVAARQIYHNNLRPVAATQAGVTLTIPSGSSLNDTAAILKKAGVIRSDWAFTRYVLNQQASNDIKAGTYELSPSQSVSEIVSIITEGKVKTDLLTIVPGQRIDQIKRAFLRNGFSRSEVDSAFDPARYRDHPALVDKPGSASLEGYLYPDSFQKTAQTRADTIVRQSLDQMQKHLTPDVRSALAKQGLSVYQGVILASIVEKEIPSSAPEARRQAAQVFIKRFRINMPLGSDVTPCYGAVLAGVMKEDQKCIEYLTYDSAYNTHLHAGLPPGPVSNVTESSLKAIASPANTDYLYFVAGRDCVTRFSATFEEHNALIEQHGLSTESESC